MQEVLPWLQSETVLLRCIRLRRKSLRCKRKHRNTQKKTKKKANSIDSGTLKENETTTLAAVALAAVALVADALVALVVVPIDPLP